MVVKCLSAFAQAAIIDGFTNRKMKQIDLATYYGVSRRTIQRVLLDHDIIVYKVRGPKPITTAGQQQRMNFQTATQQRLHENTAILNEVRDRNMSHGELVTALDSPVINRSNVEVYLARMTDNDLATLTYTIGLVRLRQHERIAAHKRQYQEAANA